MTNNAMASVEVQEKLLDIFAQLEGMTKTSHDEAEVIFFATEHKKAQLYKEARPLLKQVPDFWLLTFDVLALNPRKLGREEIEAERPIMEHLEDVAVELDAKAPQSAGKIIFYFSANKFFKETELVLEWSGINTEDFKFVHPTITWFKPITAIKHGFFAWLSSVEEEDMIKEVVLELYPNAISRYFGGDESDDELDGFPHGSDSSDSEDLSGSEESGEEKPPPPQKKSEQKKSEQKKPEQKKEQPKQQQQSPKKKAGEEHSKPTKKRKH